MEQVKTITLADGRSLEIHVDDNPESPREWDNMGTMVCFHRRYRLGDKSHNYSEKDFSSWDELRAKIEEDHHPALIYPIFLYDHSGITINMGGFADCDIARWDWGQVGFIFVSEEKVCKEYSVKSVTTEVLQRAKNCLLAEVEVYRQYLEGDVYGFVLRAAPKHCDVCNHTEDGEELDSCWGFYGNDIRENGMLEHLPEDIHEEVITKA